MDKIKAKLYKDTFNSNTGKKVIKDLMDFSHFMKPCHDPNNSHNTAFNDGARRVVLRILSFLNYEEALEIYNDPNNRIINYNDED